jgi:hypothetical protein
MATINIFPLNDLVLEVKLKKVSTTTGATVPLESGTVTAFLANAKLPTTVAADPSLSVTPTHVGSGRWIVEFDAALLDPAIAGVATFFAAPLHYCIIQVLNGSRTYVDLTYAASRAATVP